MKTLYFTVREIGGGHIGTVGVTNDKELIQKLEIACESHFDETVGIHDVTIVWEKVEYSFTCKDFLELIDN